MLLGNLVLLHSVHMEILPDNLMLVLLLAAQQFQCLFNGCIAASAIELVQQLSGQPLPVAIFDLRAGTDQRVRVIEQALNLFGLLGEQFGIELRHGLTKPV